MAQRHALAIAAADTTDLLELADYLIHAVKEVNEEGDKPPFMDPAVRLLCFQIAFAGNGDIQFYQYYADVYEFCAATVAQDQLGFIPKDKPAEPKDLPQ